MFGEEVAVKRREFLAAGRKSLAEYERTGIAYSHDDVWRYLKARIQGKKAAKPRPIKLRMARR